MPSFLQDPAPPGLVRLPCGTRIDLGRSRWNGPLTRQEMVACRNAGIALAYDPVQIGWVLADRQTREDYAIRTAGRAPVQATHPSALQSRYHLRQWRADDLGDYVALLDDPAVWAHLPEAYPAPLTRDLAEALIELSNASNHHEVQAIVSDSGPVGQVRLLFADDDTADRAEISYWIGQAHWGKGIASQVVGPYSDQSFGRHPQLQSLFGRVHPENAASARVLAKAGYRHKGADKTPGGWQVYQRDRADRPQLR